MLLVLLGTGSPKCLVRVLLVEATTGDLVVPVVPLDYQGVRALEGLDPCGVGGQAQRPSQTRGVLLVVDHVGVRPCHRLEDVGRGIAIEALRPAITHPCQQDLFLDASQGRLARHRRVSEWEGSHVVQQVDDVGRRQRTGAGRVGSIRSCRVEHLHGAGDISPVRGQQTQGVHGRNPSSIRQSLSGSALRQQLVEEHAPPGGFPARLPRHERNRLRQDRAAHPEPVDRGTHRDEVEVTPGVSDEITDVGLVEMNLEARHQSSPRESPPEASSRSGA